MQANSNNMKPTSYDKYTLTEDDEKNLWQECFFVFDSSVLLNFYNYPKSTRQQIYAGIFENKELKDKLWIPSHVQFEYLKNRKSVIKKPLKSYDNPEKILNEIQSRCEEIEKKTESLKQETKKSDAHPHIDQEDFEPFESAISSYKAAITVFDKNVRDKFKERQVEIENLEKNDTVLESFKKYFSVGREYNFEEIIEITKEGKHRYEFKIPPGYEDLQSKEKIGTQIFGDLIIWKQILEFAFEKKTNIVFICDDLKEDWWILKDKKNLSAREELIKEFSDKTGKRFWMYDQRQFVFAANKLLLSKVDEQKIENILPINEPSKIQEIIKNFLSQHEGKLELKIIDAKYYTDSISIDVTTKLQSLVKNNTLETIANNDLIGDPHPGFVKKLTVKYLLGILNYEQTLIEGELLRLP